MTGREANLAAVAAAAAAVLAEVDYRAMRVDDVAALVDLPGRRGRPSRRAGRSAMWVYGEVRAKRVLYALAVAHHWVTYLDQIPPPVEQSGHVASVSDARELMRSALGHVASFCRTQPRLIAQVRAGLGDTSGASHAGDNTEPPWDPACWWGAVADAAWGGRCAAFADILRQTLEIARTTIGPVEPPGQRADHLSDLAALVCGDDQEAAVDMIADGLEGYWFSRYVEASNPWALSVERAERALDGITRKGRGARHAARARSNLIRDLLESNVLLVRAAHEGAALHAQIDELLTGEYPPSLAVSNAAREELLDLRSDVRSRTGFALHRIGHDTRAEAWLQHSGEAAGHDGATLDSTDESRRARRLTNLADVYAGQGRPGRAIELASEAVSIRQRLHREQPTPTTWDRLSLSEQAWIRAMSTAGSSRRAVRAARRLLDDRLARQRGVAAARRTAARALREAGHPDRARVLLSAAHPEIGPYYLEHSYAYQSAVLELACSASDLGDVVAATELLADSPAHDDWFLRHVSPRLGLEIRLWHAKTLAMSGRAADEAIASLRGVIEAARQEFGLAHPTTTACRREYAAALSRLDPEAAVSESQALIDVAEPADRAFPPFADSLVVLARANTSRGRLDAAEGAAEWALQLRGTGVDPQHPSMLAAHFALAEIAYARGAIDSVRDHLSVVLDRTPIIDPSGPVGDADGWDLPALEGGHVLAMAARRLDAKIIAGAPHDIAADWRAEAVEM